MSNVTMYSHICKVYILLGILVLVQTSFCDHMARCSARKLYVHCCVRLITWDVKELNQPLLVSFGQFACRRSNAIVIVAS
jgi:hypothetical protein